MASNLAGLRDLTRRLRALGRLEDGKAIRAAVREAIKPALKRAKQTVPVGSYAHKTYRGRLVGPGFLKRSIRVETVLSRDKQSASALLGVRREAFYGLQFVELGTSKMPAQPWLIPAFEGTISDAEQALATSLSKAVDKAIGAR
jgi:HK97 gp10 family phage protein